MVIKTFLFVILINCSGFMFKLWLLGSNEFIPVPDAEKHSIGMYERRSVATFKSGETAAYHTRGTYDFMKGNGLFRGYDNMTYNDGSMVVIKYTGELTLV